MSETFAQRVERLKQNEKPFGLLATEDQKVLCKVGEKCCQRWDGGKDYNWVQAFGFAADMTYRIRPDYQPEPEYVDVPIESDGNFLGVWRRDSTCVPSGFTTLSYLPSLPGFHGFRHKEGGFIYLSQVARFITEGKAVVARFRKE